MHDAMAAADEGSLEYLAAVAVQRSSALPSFSAVIHETLVLSAGDAPLRRQRSALMAARQSPEQLSSIHAAAVFSRCLVLTGVPIDPYRPPGIEMLARLAAIQILAAHPDIDARIRAQLLAPSSATLAVVAGAMRRRQDGRDESVAAIFETWKPNQDAALTFARAIDSRFSSADPYIKHNGSQRVAWGFLPRFIRLFALVLSGPLVAAAGWWAFEHWHPTRAWDVGMAETAAILAIFVAVHIFAAELGAARLPGLLARRTSTPPALVMGYSTSLSAIMLAAVSESGYKPARTSSAATACLGIAIALGVITIVALVRRTDPVVAVLAFGRVHTRSAIRAGRRIRRTRRLTRDARTTILSSKFASLDPGRPLAERRVPIRAKRTGTFGVSVRRLGRIGHLRRWQGGQLSLRLQQSLGVMVQVGEEVAWIVPSRGATVASRDAKLATSCIRIRRQSRTERETIEAAVILAGLADDVAATANSPAAGRIAATLVAVLSEHLRAAREPPGADTNRSELNASETPPVTMALKAAIQVASQRMRRAGTETQRETLTLLLQRILAEVHRGEGGPTMIATNIANYIAEPDQKWAVADVLRSAWIRAVEFDDSTELTLVRSSIDQAVRDTAGTPRELGIELASHAVIATVWMSYFRASEMWEWYWQLTDTPGAGAGHRIGAIRIGAVGLLSGELSIALRVSLALRDAGINVGAFEDWVKSPTVRAHEQFVSDLYGRYLLKDAEAAERSFCRFATKVAASVS